MTWCPVRGGRCTDAGDHFPPYLRAVERRPAAARATAGARPVFAAFHPRDRPVSQMRTQPSRSGLSGWRVAERGCPPAATPRALRLGDRASLHLRLRYNRPCSCQLATCRSGPLFLSCKLTSRSSGGRCGDRREAGSGGPGWPGPVSAGFAAEIGWDDVFREKTLHQTRWGRSVSDAFVAATRTRSICASGLHEYSPQ